MYQHASPRSIIQEDISNSFHASYLCANGSFYFGPQIVALSPYYPIQPRLTGP